MWWAYREQIGVRDSRLISPTVATNVCDLQWDGKLSRFLHHLIDMTFQLITTWSLFCIYRLATSQNMPGLREALFCVCVCLVGMKSNYSSKFLWCIPQKLNFRYSTIELTCHFVSLKMVLYHYLRWRFSGSQKSIMKYIFYVCYSRSSRPRLTLVVCCLLVRWLTVQ